MTRRPWLAPCLLVIAIGLWAGIAHGAALHRALGAVAVVAGCALALAGEIGSRRRR